MTPAQAMQRVTKVPVEAIPVDKIVEGVRRRKIVGQIDRLAKSIAEDGLMNPILVTDELVLIAGLRRLRAVQSLGWKTVPGRKVAGLTPEELRQLELDENTHRLGYEPSETTRERSREMALEEERRREEKQAPGVSSDDPTKLSKRGRAEGRPPKPGSVRAKAAAVGVHPSTAADIDKAAALAEQFPCVAGDGWSRANTLEAGTALATAHEGGFGPAAERLIEDQPPAKATAILTKLATIPAKPRAELVHMVESRDEAQIANVRTVLTTGNVIPPDILHRWKKDVVEPAARHAQSITRRYPKLAKKLQELVGKMHDATSDIEAAYAEEVAYWRSTVGGSEGHGRALAG